MNPMDELIAATDRLALAAERRDYSTGCAITVMNARAELAEAAKNARAALARTQSVAAAAPQPPAEAQPGEWVLVPRVPTFAMRNTFTAGMGSATHFTHTTLQCADFDSRYSHMLAAAPQPPAEAQAQGSGEVDPDGYTSYGEFRWACDCDARQRREWTPVYLAPPSAPVGVEVKVLARDVHYAIRDAGLAPESPADDAAMRDAILRTLAQQPAAVDGATE